MDTVTKEKRSWVMGRIHSKNTKPEMRVRSFLHCNGFRFRLHVKTLPGKPDIVLPKYKTVIEVRGCFWHHHEGCKTAATPSSNVELWQEKFERNVARDRRTEAGLRELGWNLIVVWECDLKKPGFLDSLPDRIHRNIQSPPHELPESDSRADVATPGNLKQRLHELISDMTQEQLSETLEVMIRFASMTQSDEYRKFIADSGNTQDDIDDFMFERVLGKDKAQENAKRRLQLRKNAGGKQ